MDRIRIAHAPAPDYALRRVHQDGTEEAVSEHTTFADGWSAGQRAVYEDRDHAYAPYRGRTRIARFCHRLMSRPAGGNLDALAAMLGAV